MRHHQTSRVVIRPRLAATLLLMFCLSAAIPGPVAAQGGAVQGALIGGGIGAAVGAVGYVIKSRRPVRAEPEAVDFKKLTTGESADRPLVLRNRTDRSMSVGAIAVSGDGFAFVEEPRTPFEIPAHGEKELRVRFAPRSDGKYSGTLEISTSDPSRAKSSRLKVRLKGRAGSAE